MPIIKPALTQQRRQLLGSHDNWRYKHRPRREQQIQAEPQPSVVEYPKKNILTLATVDQHDSSPDEAISTSFPKSLPKSILALAALAAIATVGEAAAAQPQTPPYRQRIPRPTSNPVNKPARTAFSAAPARSASGRLHPTSRSLHHTSARPSGLHSQALSVALVSSPNRIAHAIALAKPLSVAQVDNDYYDAKSEQQHIFLDYMSQHIQPGIHRMNNVQGRQMALKTYLLHPGPHFTHDQKLLDKLFGQQPVQAHDKVIKMRALARALTQDIDFSTTIHSFLITDDGFTLRGLNGMSLIDCQKKAISFYREKLLAHTTAMDNHANEQLAKLLLPLELSLSFKSDEPDLQDTRYGNQAWLELKTGSTVMSRLGQHPDQYTIAELRALGRETIKAALPAISPIADHDYLPVTIDGLMLMANAQGKINLNTFTALPEAEQIKQLHTVAEQNFPVQMKYWDAVATIAPGLPTRSQVAEKILREHGEDPNRKVDVHQGDRSNLMLLGEYYTIPLTEAYMSMNPRINDNDLDKLNALPDLNHAFNQAFDGYKNSFVTVLSHRIKNQLNEIAQTHPGATFRILEAEIDYRAGGTPGSSQSALRMVNTEKGTGVTFVEIQCSKGFLYYQLQHNQLDKGLQAIPPYIKIKDWVRDHINDIAGATLVATAKERTNESLWLHNFKQNLISSDSKQIAQSLIDIHAQDQIEPYRTQAYQTTAYEQGRQANLAFLCSLVPFCSTITAAQTGNVAEAVSSGLVDAFSFIAFAAKGFQLGKAVTKTAIQASAQGMSKILTQGVKQGWRAGANAAAAIGSKHLPKITKLTGQLVWEGLEVLNPIPLLPFSIKTTTLPKTEDLTHIGQNLKTSYPKLAADLQWPQRQHIVINHNKWVSTQPAIIHASVQEQRNLYQSTQIIHGREYVIAQLGDQTQVFFKKHRAQDGTDYVTQVNPLTDESYGLHYYLSSKNKIYLTDKTAEGLLKEYRLMPEVMQRYPVLENNRGHLIVDLNMGAPVYLTHQENIFHVLINNKPYLIEKNERGMTFIIHPDKPAAKIPVEAADKKWRLPMDEIPHEFQEIKKGHTQSWTHPLTREKLIVTRLMDQGRVVALKHKGGGYREVNWATGESYHQRPLIFKQAEGQFSQASLAGGMKDGDDLPGTSHSKSTAPKRVSDQVAETHAKQIKTLEPASDSSNWYEYLREDESLSNKYSGQAKARQEKLYEEYDTYDALEEYAAEQDKEGIDSSLVDLYTQNSNQYFNNYFRYDGASGKIDQPELIDHLADVLELLPQTQEVTLYRGGSGARGTSGAHFRTGTIKIGDQLVNTEFTSFTENPYAAKRFFGDNPNGRHGQYHYDDTSVVFILKNPQDARAIMPLSLTPEEAESLYTPGHGFIVKDINMLSIDGHPLVQVQIEENSHGLLSGNTFDFRTGEPFDRQTMEKRIGREYTERFFGD